jgi:hypothetical protein
MHSNRQVADGARTDADPAWTTLLK